MKRWQIFFGRQLFFSSTRFERHTTGHAVFSGNLKQLVKDLTNIRFWNRTLKQWSNLTANERHNRGNRLHLECVSNVRIGIYIDGDEDERTIEVSYDTFESGRKLLARLAPCRPQVNNDGNSSRKFDKVSEIRIGCSNDK